MQCVLKNRRWTNYFFFIMISKDNLDFIIKCVENEIFDCLIECKFDPTIKEPGHSYGEKVEEILTEKLANKYPEKFAHPIKNKSKGKQTRKMEDLIWIPSNNLINIKLGYKKGNGQPNMVSFNRLCKNYCENLIDSYWILLIDVNGDKKENLTTKVYIFNLLDYLDYVVYNYGTGQVMLNEKKFFNDFDSNKYLNKTKNGIVLKLKNLDHNAFYSHIKLKEKQHKEKQEKFDAYLKVL
jgi:hypothetical protein